MSHTIYIAFERKAEPFGSTIIPEADSYTDKIGKALLRLSGYGMRPTTYPCDSCGAELWKSACPAHLCQEGEIHEADFTWTTCEVCEGTGTYWWCANPDCHE